MTLIPHSRPWIAKADATCLSAVLRTGMIGQGKFVRELERKIASWVGASDGAAVASGSAALVLALRALGTRDGDEVIVPSYVCAEVAEAALACGAQPIFCDVGEDWVITKESVAPHITARTRAIIVPHLYGVFADAASIRALGTPVIEDFAQALELPGARHLSGDIGVFSFHPTKCLTTGEGGAAVATDPQLVESLRNLRDGNRETLRARVFAPMSELAAALGLTQLNRYPEGFARRKLLAESYFNALNQVAPQILARSSFAKSMHFRFVVHIEGGLEAVQSSFEARGIAVRRGVDQLLHRLIGLSDAHFPVSVAHFRQTVSIPIFPALSDLEHALCLAAAVEILPKFLTRP